MKIREKTAKHGSGKLLVIFGDRGDTIDYVAAERIRRGDLNVFLPFTYTENAGKIKITYLVSEYKSLAQLAEDKIPSTIFQSLLISSLEVLKSCESSELSRIKIDFSDNRVFLEPKTKKLRFLYVPLSSYISSNSEASLLQRICTLKGIDAASRQLAATVLDYASRTPLITSVEFEQVLLPYLLIEHNICTPPPIDDELIASSLHDRRHYGFDFANTSNRLVAGISSETKKIPEPPKRRCIMLSDKRARKAYKLSAGTYSIGRDNSCDIQLPFARGISRKHAEITVSDEESCVILDNNSTNGVFINDALIIPEKPYPLENGDVVLLGDVKLTFEYSK